MGSSQRLAAVAAASHARHYNHSHEVLQTETAHYNVNILFVSATLCGVLVAVCAACWRRSPSSNKPEDVSEVSGVYTVSGDSRLNQVVEPPPGPPPAYDTVVDCPAEPKDCSLQEVTTESCSRCKPRCDSGLPSYEAAVMLKDTKL
ncbi:uncharacterized protein LOC134655416 [Cydia amplana]|uniref:uncharacterized protein LOC134655416 n=1 Tax=Cydia amplana TaxID=1869771 RepID=UPI002FE62E16